MTKITLLLEQFVILIEKKIVDSIAQNMFTVFLLDQKKLTLQPVRIPN